MRYIKTFNTHSQYIAYRDGNNYVRPNVSYCIDNDEVHYNYYPPIVAKFNVTSTSSPTAIATNLNTFSQIEVDGVVQPNVVSSYAFSTTGEHTVRYTLTDPKTIGSRAFQYCSGLTSITIPDSVTSIDNYAFQYCSGLTSVTIPDSVTTIGEVAFYACSGFTSITIPNTVTSIGNNAFQRCSGLTSITMGSGVTSIGGQAFYYCSSLTSVTIQATTPPTLSSFNAFTNTNDCPIYVPSASVEAYKAATNWSGLASRIQAIQQ